MSDLSPQQRAAVERLGGEVCVVAGPGSGKTRVLIERFAWLVESQGVDPGRILAITFTEKAAAEIKQRLVRRFEGRPDLRESLERAWVTTIDAFCTRLLLENAIVAGLSPDFSILEPALAERLKREAAEQALDELFDAHPVRMRHLLQGLDLATSDDTPQQDLAAALLEVYEAQRVSGIREAPVPEPIPSAAPRIRELCRAILGDRSLAGNHADLLRNWARDFLGLPDGRPETEHFRVLGGFTMNRNQISRKGPAAEAAKELKEELLPRLHAQWIEEWYEGVPELIRSALSRLDALYRDRKRNEATLDFHDLEENSIRLLESNDRVFRETRARFDHVLMDELQDTNRLQWRLVNLVRQNFFAVGDINQSIYGFRHADPKVFAEYRGQVQSRGVVDLLNENYRSRAEILTTVQSAFEQQPGIEPHCLNPLRSDLKPRNTAVERLVGMGDRAAEVEASLVAQSIREFVDSGEHALEDIAVLVRALSSTEPFEKAFDRYDIPFVVGGGRTFLEARETRDVMLLLRALVNPSDEIATVGVLRSPFFGISDEEIYRLGRQGWLQEFERVFGGFRKMAGFIAPDRLLAQALDQCGYAEGLPPRARANLDKLLGWLRREFASRPRPLAALLDDLESLRATRSEAEAPPPEAGVVRILSVHAAKGLEFPVVFIAAMHRTPDQRSAAMTFSPTLGLGWKWRNPVTGEAVPSRTHKLIQEERKALEQAEENRLLYVAMTRAEDRLILSYAERSNRKSSWQKIAERTVHQVTSSIEIPDLPPRRLSKAGVPAADLILPKAVPTGQYDSTASVTSIALFDACPRRYYLSRYLGFEPEPQEPGTGATELGLQVHRALAGQEVESPQAQRLRERFEASPLGQRALRAGQIEREFDVLFAIDDVVLRGQIDLWFEEGGELILVDYKSGRDESESEAYALQLRLYALALSRYAGRMPDRAVLYYLWSDHALDVGLEDENLEGAKGKVRELREAQERLHFPMKPGEPCRKCEFHGGLCPAPEIN